MVKGISYFLLFIVLSENFYLSQFLKIPVLVIHYHEHQQLNPKVDLTDFFSMHYFGEHISDQDDERDMQLPFKKLDDSQLPFVFYFKKPYNSLPYKAEVVKGYKRYQEAHFSSLHCGSLFKPPRV